MSLEIDKEYRYTRIEEYAQAHGLEIEGFGPKLYDDDDGMEGDQFLMLTKSGGDNPEMTFVWTGDAGGAIYKRTT